MVWAKATKRREHAPSDDEHTGWQQVPCARLNNRFLPVPLIRIPIGVLRSDAVYQLEPVNAVKQLVDVHGDIRVDILRS